MQKDKIGVGLITCDRPDFFKKSLASLKNNYDLTIVVVDDGLNAVIDETCEVSGIKTTGKIGVGASKNKALKFLIEAECEHIFLMEDDIEITNSEVFNFYIKTAKETGVKHLNFALHGNHNLDLARNPIKRKIINYPSSAKIALYPNILGAFSYYHIDVLNSMGLMDEQFYNALEHVDHTYQIIKAGYHPPFRWFADIEGSENYLKDVVPDHQESKIRSQEDFMKNFMKNHERFMKKNGFSVLAGIGTPENEYTEEQVIESLKNIWKSHQQTSE
jgi:GT2 family glycosyltransferase